MILKDLARILKKDTFGQFGIGFIAFFILAATLCPFVAQDPDAHSILTFQPPSSHHWLGTNDVGQDIWSRLLWGARTSLLIALGVGFLATGFSITIGVTAALIGGVYEILVMRLIDALLAIPTVVVLIVITAFLRPSIFVLVVLISSLHWQGGARILRSQTLAVKNRLHILAAKTFGAGRLHIIVRHILPELGPILIVSFIYTARMAIFIEAGLAFVGISDPSTISWGRMMYHSSKFYYLPVWEWWLLPPGVALSLLIVGFTSIGYSLERVLEPRLKNA
jgi:peptide/nickel transport system permease protein